MIESNEPHIVRTVEEDVDGIIYIISIYSDGHIKKHRKEGYENAITNTEQRQLDLEMNVQYLVALAEINEGA